MQLECYMNLLSMLLNVFLSFYLLGNTRQHHGIEIEVIYLFLNYNLLLWVVINITADIITKTKIHCADLLYQEVGFGHIMQT